MKGLIWIFAVSIIVGAGLAQAQMGGAGDRDRSRMTGAEQSSHRMGSQMMRQEHFREMSRMMAEMREMLREMSRIMDQGRLRDGDRRQEMAQLMGRMSEALRTMSRHMEQGQLSDAERDRLRQQLRDMEQTMEGLEEGADE